MGTFFTNVQVHSGGHAADASRTRIIEHLRAGLAAQGLVEGGAPETAVRRVLVGPPAEGPWIAVYDAATEGQDDRDIVGLTTLLSKALPGPAVGVRAHDGDLLDLWLREEGATRDHMCSWPAYFAGKPPPRKSTGKPAAWRALLVGEATPRALGSAWEATPQPDATALLQRMAPLLGWDAAAVCCGFRSLPEALRARCTGLSFAAPIRAGEPARLPALGHAGGTPGPIRARVGETITLQAIAHNTGGPLRGLSVVLFGPAIDAELIRPEGLSVALGSPGSGQRRSAPLLPVSTAGQMTWTATLSDAALPAGHPDVASAYRTASSAEEGLAAWLSSRAAGTPLQRSPGATSSSHSSATANSARLSARRPACLPTATPTRMKWQASLPMSSRRRPPIQTSTPGSTRSPYRYFPATNSYLGAGWPSNTSTDKHIYYRDPSGVTTDEGVSNDWTDLAHCF